MNNMLIMPNVTVWCCNIIILLDTMLPACILKASLMRCKTYIVFLFKLALSEITIPWLVEKDLQKSAFP
jgi:hypothetical protein